MGSGTGIWPTGEEGSTTAIVNGMRDHRGTSMFSMEF